MILHAHSDASSCLSAPKSRSKLGGCFCLSSRPKDPHRQPDSSDPMPPMNGAILVNANVIKHVMSSAAEAELGGLFFNMKDAVPIRAALEEMGHPQPPAAVVVDNSAASGIANKTVKQRRSKAMDMRFCWVQDRTEQRQFQVCCWRKGAQNFGRLFYKAPSRPLPCRHMRPVCLHVDSN